MCCLDIFGPHRAEKAQLWVPLLPPSSRKAAHPASSPISWTNYTTFSPQPSGFTSLTAWRLVQRSQVYPPVGTKGHLTLLLLQVLLPCASACSHYPKCNPHVVLHGVQCPLPSLYPQIVSVYYKLTAINLICPVSKYQVLNHLVLFKEEDPSLTKTVNRRWLEQGLSPLHLWQNSGFGDHRMGSQGPSFQSQHFQSGM